MASASPNSDPWVKGTGGIPDGITDAGARTGWSDWDKVGLVRIAYEGSNSLNVPAR